MGWYNDFQNSDWFKVAKDVADGAGRLYEAEKHAQSKPRQDAAIYAVEQEQNPNAQTLDPKVVIKNAQSAVNNGLSKYAIYGVGAAALITLAVVALKG